jgi:hypothetical protein
MNLINNLTGSGSVLFVSNGCGGGHIQAVNSLEKQLSNCRPELRSKVIDVYKNSFGETVGNLVIDRWSRQQKEGDVAGLNNYLKYRWVERYLLSIFVFLGFLAALLKNDIDVVVNVQPFGVEALLSAVRVVNCIRRIFGFKKRTQIKIHMVLTELPNAQTTNFFPGIRALSPSNRKYFTLYSTQPLLKENQTEEEFWQKHCGLSMKEVVYDAFPVRQGFFDQQKLSRPQSLQVQEKSEENRRKILRLCPDSAREEEDGLKFDLHPEDTVLSIHLGGQACVSAAKQYVLFRIKDKELRPNKEYVFILCGDNTGEESLFSQIVEMANSEGIPDNLRIVPLTRQTDREIASILARSDKAIIKSGGLTSMEVFVVPPKKTSSMEGKTECRFGKPEMQSI